MEPKDPPQGSAGDDVDLPAQDVQGGRQDADVADLSVELDMHAAGAVPRRRYGSCRAQVAAAVIFGKSDRRPSEIFFAPLVAL